MPDNPAYQENRRGEWVPSIPIPLYVGWLLRSRQCHCGRKFRSDEQYEGHYALVHILNPR